jgi:hypothetical protein
MARFGWSGAMDQSKECIEALHGVRRDRKARHVFLDHGPAERDRRARS